MEEIIRDDEGSIVIHQDGKALERGKTKRVITEIAKRRLSELYTAKELIAQKDSSVIEALWATNKRANRDEEKYFRVIADRCTKCRLLTINGVKQELQRSERDRTEEVETERSTYNNYTALEAVEIKDSKATDGALVLNVRALPSFTPPISKGCVVKVYDGDTITIATRIPGLNASPIYKFHVRLNGVDTPELRTRDEEEKVIAQKAQEVLSKRVFGKNVQLSNISVGKYGRLIADVHHDGLDINQWLLGQRLAVPYDGGKKTSPASWIRYHKTGALD